MIALFAIVHLDKAPDIAVEVDQQLRRRHKTIELFVGSVIAMVAFARFVIVANKTRPRSAAVQPILETVGSVLGAAGKLPYDTLYDGAVGKLSAIPDYQAGTHALG
jgi:hypothetical protein